MSKRIGRRSIAALLAAVMVFTAAPVSASAAETNDAAEEIAQAVTETAEETDAEALETQSADVLMSEEETEAPESSKDAAETETVAENVTESVLTDEEQDSTDASAVEVLEEEETQTEETSEIEREEIFLKAVNSELNSQVLANLQNQFPHGKYWNNDKNWTDSPCTHHQKNSNNCNVNGGCGCNYYMGIQCWGFARKMASIYYNQYPDWSGGNNGTKDLNGLKAGDIIQYYTPWHIKYGVYDNFGHTIWVTKVVGDQIIYADCNAGMTCQILWNQSQSLANIQKGLIKRYVAPNDPHPSGHNPRGTLDEVRGGAGSVTVRGWALDQDAPNQPLAIDVYIGGPAGSGVPYHRITADKLRTDVGNVYPETGNYHGFEETIPTDKTGVQDVYVYALNVGDGNDNPQIGKGTVTISDRVKGTYMNTGYSRVIPDGYYHIVSSFGDQWWLTISEPSNINGANVHLWDYSIRDFECDEQLFYFQFIDEGNGRGFYKITSKQTGKCLDVKDASEYMYDENGNPTNVWQWTDNGSAGQQWAVKEVDGGDKGVVYALQARCSGFFLDLWLAKTENGANISIHSGEGPAKQWRLVPYVLPKLSTPTSTLSNTTAVNAGTKFYLNKNDADDIYYTWDGTTPTKQSAKYSDSTGLTIPTGKTTCTLKAFGVKEGYQDSDILEITYTVKQTEDEDPQEGVKWHYDEQKVTYKDLSQYGQIATTIKPKTYDGTPYKPAVKVTAIENGKTVTLTEGTDYRVLYFNNAHAGTGSVIVKGNGIYKGTISKKFEINKKSCQKLKVVTNSMLTGDSAAPKIYVYDGNILLKENKDYTLDGITPNFTATKGTKQIYVMAAQNSDYEGIKTAKITIYDADKGRIKGILDRPENVTLSQSTYQYTGKACKPTATVTVDGNTLTAGKDYTIKYQNNKDTGTASATITGKGSYVGSVVKEFTIKPSNGEFTLKKPIAAVTYNGKLQKPKITVTADGKTLKQNKDYTLTYTNNLHATDRARVTVRGKGNYAAIPTKIFYFTINPCHIKKASVKGGQGSLLITHAKHTLVEGVDYDVIYGDTVGKGKISVTIKAKEGSSFTGEVTKKVKQ